MQTSRKLEPKAEMPHAVRIKKSLMMQHKRLKSTDFILPEQGLEDKTNNTKPTQCKLQRLAGCAPTSSPHRRLIKGYAVDKRNR